MITRWLLVGLDVAIMDYRYGILEVLWGSIVVRLFCGKSVLNSVAYSGMVMVPSFPGLCLILASAMSVTQMLKWYRWYSN